MIKNWSAQNRQWTKNIPGVDSGTHGILAVVYQDNAYYYSRNIIQNRQLLPVKAEGTTDLPKNCVAFRLNTGQEEIKAKVIINGTKTEEITSGETV